MIVVLSAGNATSKPATTCRGLSTLSKATKYGRYQRRIDNPKAMGGANMRDTPLRMAAKVRFSGLRALPCEPCLALSGYPAAPAGSTWGLGMGEHAAQLNQGIAQVDREDFEESNLMFHAEMI